MILPQFHCNREGTLVLSVMETCEAGLCHGMNLPRHPGSCPDLLEPSPRSVSSNTFRHRPPPGALTRVPLGALRARRNLLEAAQSPLGDATQCFRVECERRAGAACPHTPAAVALPIACGTPCRSCPGRCQKVWTRRGWGREAVERKFHGLAGTRGRGSSTVLGRTRVSGKIPEGLRRARGPRVPEGLPAHGMPPGNVGIAWEGHGARRRF